MHQLARRDAVVPCEPRLLRGSDRPAARSGGHPQSSRPRRSAAARPGAYSHAPTSGARWTHATRRCPQRRRRPGRSCSPDPRSRLRERRRRRRRRRRRQAARNRAACAADRDYEVSVEVRRRAIERALERHLHHDRARCCGQSGQRRADHVGALRAARRRSLPRTGCHLGRERCQQG